MSIEPPKLPITKKQARDQLWRSGLLSFKLDRGQKVLYKLFYDANHRVMTWLLARRQGKTFCLCVLAIEQCIRKPNSIVKILSPTKIQVVNNVRPIMRKILEDCPEDLRPEFKTKDWIYYFPNGSEIQVAGSDSGHAEKLRGGDCLEKDTLVMTPNGPKAIQDFKSGDIVYGYNKDGSISETKIIDLLNNGKKQVRNIYKEGKKILACTDNHKFLTITDDLDKKERILSDITPLTKFCCINQNTQSGDIDKKESYLILDIDTRYYEADCYDLSVDNETHLYLLANGIVTHNSDLWMIDEAGSCDNLKYIVQSILIPTTLMTKGKGVLASTPPAQSEHEFLYFLEEAEKDKSLVKKTIFDNPRITMDDIIDMTKQLGGQHTDAYRREMLCEIIKDSSTSVIPEFTEELQTEIIKDWPRPPFWDGYVSMDLGGKDLTVVIFGYYDFRSNKVIIEDELEIDFQQQDMNIQELTSRIAKKEHKLWFNPMINELKSPYMRISDINYIVTQEINKHSNGTIVFTTPKKDDKDAALHDLRIMLQNKKIIIHPKCTTLIRHLKNVKWRDKSKNGFGRSPDNGHYDAVDALKYLIRSIQFNRNPYPHTFDYNLQDLHVANPEKFFKNDQIEIYKRIFNIKKRR